MNLLTLLRNLFAAPSSLPRWKMLRSELNGFDWNENEETFERGIVTVTGPRDGGPLTTALSFEVRGTIRWHWTPDTDGDLPDWPSAYTVLDAREMADQVAVAMAGQQEEASTFEEQVEEALARIERPAPEPPSVPVPPRAYERPELTDAHQAEAAQLALRFTNGASMKEIRLRVVALLCENQRLTLEVNDHRAARGFDPLPVFETNGRH